MAINISNRMDKNLKLVLFLAALALFLGLGYFALTKKSISSPSEQSLLPSPNESTDSEPSQESSSQPETGLIDDFIASLVLDSYSENILFQEESTGLDQTLNSESQAISDFGQSYDSSEL